MAPGATSPTRRTKSDRRTISFVETHGTTIAVVSDEGVFKQQKPVPASVKPHQILHLPLPSEGESTALSDADDDATGWSTAMELIGCLKDKDGATDVARNHDKYLYHKA